MITEAGSEWEETKQTLERLGRELDIQRLALTMVPTFGDTESDVSLYSLASAGSHSADGLAARTTFIVYKGRVIIDKYENLEPNEADFRELTRKLR